MEILFFNDRTFDKSTRECGLVCVDDIKTLHIYIYI